MKKVTHFQILCVSIQASAWEKRKKKNMYFLSRKKTILRQHAGPVLGDALTGLIGGFGDLLQ